MNETIARQTTIEDHDHSSRKGYFYVYGALLLLLLATYGAAYLELGVLHTPVALGIAVVKALLIVYFFMHLRGSNRLIWLFAAAGFAWLLIMLVITMGDFVARG